MRVFDGKRKDQDALFGKKKKKEISRGEREMAGESGERREIYVGGGGEGSLPPKKKGGDPHQSRKKKKKKKKKSVRIVKKAVKEGLHQEQWQKGYGPVQRRRRLTRAKKQSDNAGDKKNAVKTRSFSALGGRKGGKKRKMSVTGGEGGLLSITIAKRHSLNPKKRKANTPTGGKEADLRAREKKKNPWRKEKNL